MTAVALLVIVGALVFAGAAGAASERSWRSRRVRANLAWWDAETARQHILDEPMRERACVEQEQVATEFRQWWEGLTPEERAEVEARGLVRAERMRHDHAVKWIVCCCTCCTCCTGDPLGVARMMGRWPDPVPEPAA